MVSDPLIIQYHPSTLKMLPTFQYPNRDLARFDSGARSDFGDDQSEGYAHLRPIHLHHQPKDRLFSEPLKANYRTIGVKCWKCRVTPITFLDSKSLISEEAF